MSIKFILSIKIQLVSMNAIKFYGTKLLQPTDFYKNIIYSENICIFYSCCIEITYVRNAMKLKK